MRRNPLDEPVRLHAEARHDEEQIAGPSCAIVRHLGVEIAVVPIEDRPARIAALYVAESLRLRVAKIRLTEVIDALIPRRDETRNRAKLRLELGGRVRVGAIPLRPPDLGGRWRSVADEGITSCHVLTCPASNARRAISIAVGIGRLRISESQRGAGGLVEEIADHVAWLARAGRVSGQFTMPDPTP